MKSIVLEAEWKPRNDYAVTPIEVQSRLAKKASMVWRRPVFNRCDSPTPDLEPDEVLIKVGACGVCGSDTHCFETDSDGYVIFSGPAKFPVIPGHEFSGEIVDMGASVRGFRKGELVVAEGMIYCGHCAACRTGRPNQCRSLKMLGFSANGAYAEYVAIKAKLCWSIDGLAETLGSKSHALELGALVEPVSCSFNGIFVAGRGMRPGDTVVVFGAGPIGLGAIALARASGAASILAFDISDARCALAIECGADVAFNPIQLNANGQSVSDVVLDFTKGWGAELVIEAAGAAQQLMPEIEAIMSPGAQMIYLGRTGERVPVMLDVLVSGASSITGARGHAGGGCFPHIIRLLERKRIHISPMITARLGFDSFHEALSQSCARTDGKIMLKYT